MGCSACKKSNNRVHSRNQKDDSQQVIFVLGGPGSGKGTQCARISKDFGYVHLSTGDLLREEAGKSTKGENELQALLKEGKLVPSEMLVKLVYDRIKSSHHRKFLIDGYPRNKENLDTWNKMVKDLKINTVLYFECSPETMTKRLTGRGATSGRADDNPETIKKRLDVFETETDPIIRELGAQGKIVQIKAEGSADEVYVEVEKYFLQKKQVVFVLGGPGSGKGTQCERIVQNYGFAHLSTGDLLREEAKKNDEQGQELQNYMKEGKLVPSELLVKLVYNKIKISDDTKFLIDGFPRNKENLDVWNKIVKGIDIKTVLYFECQQETMQKRLSGRGATSGRADDNPETIKKRLDVFASETEPILKELDAQKKVVRINAEGTANEVYELVENYFVSQKLLVFVLGGPGSGKGTQCDRLVKEFDFGHLSTGDILREYSKKNDEEAKQLQSYMKEGKLVPSELLVKLVYKKIRSSSDMKFLIDGFPRNKENLDTWNDIVKDLKINAVLYFECSPETMTKRLTGRGATSGRADDNPETIKKRLDVFASETEPIVKQLESENKIVKISAEGGADEVYVEVQKQVIAKKWNEVK